MARFGRVVLVPLDDPKWRVWWTYGGTVGGISVYRMEREYVAFLVESDEC